MTSSLWQPITVGRTELPHRLAMAPMTRNRARTDGTPGELAAEYYGQRASLGLIISEGTQPSDDGQGSFLTPGIYTPEHVAGWEPIADAVHAGGGALFIQLQHSGRMAHPDNTPHHRTPVAPSAINANQDVPTRAGMQRSLTPRQLSESEVQSVVAEFRHAAACAVSAGADGVELHAANGYLLHQFLAPNANHRGDRYGGSVENRSRFIVEVARAVADEIGSIRTGIRISPGLTLGGIDEGDPEEIRQQYLHLVGELADLKLAYLHLFHDGGDDLVREIRTSWPTALLVLRLGRTREQIADYVDAGVADIAPVGRFALANPDLVERLRGGLPLNDADPNTFYGGDEIGYVDYPVATTTPEPMPSSEPSSSPPIDLSRIPCRSMAMRFKP